MRIPTPSDVLIVGVSSVSLGFATILAKGGLNILVIDKEETRADGNTELLKLSAYSTELLKQHGFKLNEGTTKQGFTEQSLSLLAHSLCCVIWGTELVASAGGEQHLLQNGGEQLHQSQWVFTLADLEVNPANTEASFRAVFALAWRVIGVQFQKFHPHILHSFEVERRLISEFYSQKESSLWNRWIEKLTVAKSANLSLNDSPVNLHLSQQRVLEAGDLLPNLPFFDEKLKQETSLHQWLFYQHFSLIVVGNMNPQFLYSIAKWVQFNFNVKLFYLPYSERNDLIFKSLDIAPSEKRTLIIRPDKFVSMINDTVETDIIDNYLRNVLMMTANAEKS